MKIIIEKTIYCLRLFIQFPVHPLEAESLGNWDMAQCTANSQSSRCMIALIKAIKRIDLYHLLSWELTEYIAAYHKKTAFLILIKMFSYQDVIYSRPHELPSTSSEWMDYHTH